MDPAPCGDLESSTAGRYHSLGGPHQSSPSSQFAEWRNVRPRSARSSRAGRPDRHQRLPQECRSGQGRGQARSSPRSTCARVCSNDSLLEASEAVSRCMPGDPQMFLNATRCIPLHGAIHPVRQVAPRGSPDRFVRRICASALHSQMSRKFPAPLAKSGLAVFSQTPSSLTAFTTMCTCGCGSSLCSNIA
jgi:hypothetical protein